LDALKFAPVALAALLAAVSLPAYAYTTHDASCPVPVAAAHVWYVNPGAAFTNPAGLAIGAGSTPDAAHGGVAVNGVVGTADGSAAHPFNSLAGVFAGGKQVTTAPGYGRPLLSSAPWDHYGMTPNVGVNGQRKDYDWNPASPDPDRINPGDEILVESGNYGNFGIGYYAIPTNNVDAAGNTDFVTIAADVGATPTASIVSIGGARGFALSGFTVKSRTDQGSVNNGALISITGNSGTPTRDIIVDGFTAQTYASLAEANADFAANGADPSVTGNSRYLYVLSLGATPQEAYLDIRLRKGMYVRGDNNAGTDTTCVSYRNTAFSWVNFGESVSEASKVLADSNSFDYVAGDNTDFGQVNDVRFSNNTTTNVVYLSDNNHPDRFQAQVSPIGQLGPYPNVEIVGNKVYERVDPANPWLGNFKFFQNTSNQMYSGMNISDNIAEISNCPGISLGSHTINSEISHNTIVGNGAANTTHTCPQSGESPGSANNVWDSNVVAGRYYQVC